MTTVAGAKFVTADGCTPPGDALEWGIGPRPHGGETGGGPARFRRGDTALSDVRPSC